MEEKIELSKYFRSEPVQMLRSEMRPAPYNPRVIDDEARRLLKRSLRQYGVVGGIVVNRQTGNTIVGGHQKVLILDEMNKYDPQTNENDYMLRVELVDVDDTTEKQLNIALNNIAMTGRWDYDKLASMIPEIDYKAAGLTEADLSMIGMDYMFQSEEEAGLEDAFADLMRETDMAHQAELERKAEERQRQRDEIKAAQEEANERQEMELGGEKPLDERIAHVKEMKKQTWDKAMDAAADAQAYVMLSFDGYDAKVRFMRNAGYPDDVKFIKGEEFLERIEFVRDDDELEI